MSVSSFVQRSLEKKIKPPDPTPWKGDTKSHCYETPATCHTSRSKKGDNTGCRHPRREQVRQRQGLETSAPLWAAARSIQHDSKNSGYFPAVQWLESRLPMQRPRVPSLVEEIRSHMPRGATKKKKTVGGRKMAVTGWRLELKTKKP